MWSFSDVVYIGAIHTEHYRLSKLMLEAGKHVLCEKPLCVNLNETESLIKVAKTKNKFLMEVLLMLMYYRTYYIIT